MVVWFGNLTSSLTMSASCGMWESGEHKYVGRVVKPSVIDQSCRPTATTIFNLSQGSFNWENILKDVQSTLEGRREFESRPWLIHLKKGSK